MYAQTYSAACECGAVCRSDFCSDDDAERSSAGKRLRKLWRRICFALYAPATFVIKGCMALVFAYLCRSVRPRGWFVFVAALAESVMIGGYFLYECLLYTPAVALANIPGNLAQGVFGLVLSSIIVITVSTSKPIMQYAAAWKKK